MTPKILYILGGYNLYGGTPKKTLDLMKCFGKKSYLYVYNPSYNSEFKLEFERTGGTLYEGFYGRNVYLHIKRLLEVIDQEDIKVIQTQFNLGETLGFLIKLLRPKVKLIIAFVAPFKPTFFKSLLVANYYRYVDCFVYVSEYVRREKLKQFSILKRKKYQVIYNGTERRTVNGLEAMEMKQYALFDVAGLTKWKNIQILIEAVNLLVNVEKRKNIHLYIAGDGPYREHLENLTSKYSLQEHVQLLGYQNNIGQLLNSCDIFVHPSYAEGFGIAVAEAMRAEKPVIVSNAGALPELIDNSVTGLVVDPFVAKEWSKAIIRLIDDHDFAQKVATNAKKEAEQKFSVQKYVENYSNLYNELIFNDS